MTGRTILAHVSSDRSMINAMADTRPVERTGQFAEVPDLRGLVVSAARETGHEAGLVVTSSDLDGPPLGALTWPGRWVVIEQTPRPGETIRRGDTVIIQFVEDPGRNAGVREPRRPTPNPDVRAFRRDLDDGDDR